MISDVLATKTAVIAIWFAAIVIAERAFSARRWPAGERARYFRNGGMWLLVVFSTPLLVAPLTALGANELFWERPAQWRAGAAGVASILISLLILDFWTYWMHRAYHQAPWMWRLHGPHHLDEFLDASSAVRFHVGEVALSAAARLAPVALFAIPLAHLLAFETMLLASAIFHHSNLAMPERFERRLASVLVTPAYHRRHHHSKRAYTNANYASLLTVWDRLFKSRSPYMRTRDVNFGVEGERDRSLLALLGAPFGRRPL